MNNATKLMKARPTHSVRKMLTRHRGVRPGIRPWFPDGRCSRLYKALHARDR